MIGSTPDALRLSLEDIRSSSSKGKWWIVGAAWGGDPLVDNKNALKGTGGLQGDDNQSDQVLAKLAKKQGMNTDVRKSVFNVLMSSEVSKDYISYLNLANSVVLPHRIMLMLVNDYYNLD